MARRWTVSTGQDGNRVMLYDLDARARAWEAVETVWMTACHLTGGRLGGHGFGEWAWRVPVGRPRWDRSEPGDPWLENSLAGRLHDAEQWVTRRFGREERRCQVATAGIDEATARTLWGEDGIWLFDDEAQSA